MREILFRGKRLDNGEWIEGHLIRYENGRTRICESKTDIFCYEKDRSIIQTVAYETETFTVGQYTGMKDKNGKRIFEGDIIRTHYANTIATDFVEQVVFHNGRFTSLYKLHRLGNGKIFANLPDGVPHLPQDKTPYMDWCEVIGNIYDNPELLKEGDG